MHWYGLSLFWIACVPPPPLYVYTLETIGKAASLTINKWGNSKFAARIIKLTGKKAEGKKNWKWYMGSKNS